MVLRFDKPVEEFRIFMNYQPLGQNPDITPLKQTIVFILTFLVYVGLHAMRAAWAFSKSQLSDKYHYAEWINGGVDVTYLLFYSAGMATIGTMTNRFRLNFYLATGMFVAAFGFSTFAIYGYIKNDLSIPLMFVGMAINGYAQSTGWPGMMATMGNWFGKGRRGLLLAFWSVNANVGNIVGSVVCSFLNDWRLNVVVTAIISAAIGLLVMVFLKPKPNQQ